MLIFPPQPATEVYISTSGNICIKQESFELGKEIVVCLTIGQFRSMIKNSKDLIDQAELAKKESKGAL